MTSTDLAERPLRLPPLPGLLDDTLDQAIRARQRRVLVVDHPGMHLGALSVPDMAIDRAVIGACLYGRDAALLLDARIAAATGRVRDAAVFLRIALAIEGRDGALPDLALKYSALHRRSVHDAYWFFPRPLGTFDDSVDHIERLFQAGAQHESVQTLALELAGRREVARLQAPIEALLEVEPLSAWAHLALARMGVAGKATRHYVASVLGSGQQASIGSALAIAAADPRLADDGLLDTICRAGIDAGAPGAIDDLAWAMLTCRHPRARCDCAATLIDLPVALRTRVIALAGYMDGLIAACADIAASENAISPEQADVLLLGLGEVPLEARVEPNDRQSKSAALRKLVLRVCRACHIGVSNDADRCAWQADAILAHPHIAAGVRVRHGAVLRGFVPPFDAAMAELTHGLRQWLYIERAVCANVPFSMSAVDVARRQELALMIAQLADQADAD
ncbi:hypothetical protein [Massilia genomosp. 1]|uniref:Uncharacterized protein n=1 Tax=Massilia genomosp. 1 TaxID=2609280 RepID=A0ABX0MXM0_9BURK|nr:hypothetical protein [Massilia genomosp. 1]NHZ64327.1 hypothetical protein [Massilia genomosp. 1]